MRSAANLGPRRVTLEEKLKREREIALEEGIQIWSCSLITRLIRFQDTLVLSRNGNKNVRLISIRSKIVIFKIWSVSRAAMEAQMSDSRQTPSPTRVEAQPAPSHLRPVHGHHHRTDSDTVQTAMTAGSPTVIERRRSPSNVASDSNSSGEHNRPNVAQYQNGDRLAANVVPARRRSPTNPEQPPSHEFMAAQPGMQGDNMWAPESGQEAEDHRQDILYQKQLAKAAMHQQQMLQQAQPQRKAPQQQIVYTQGKTIMVN